MLYPNMKLFYFNPIRLGGGVKSTPSLVFAQLLKKSRLEPTIKHPPKVLFFAIFSREKIIFSENCIFRVLLKLLTYQVGGGVKSTPSYKWLKWMVVNLISMQIMIPLPQPTPLDPPSPFHRPSPHPPPPF